ncbi:carbohydrate kinase [Propioniciclava coleopterorum]|uniref:Carbohydrate kinase n=1 Tax=Propioniciclava coleopterorum TaxID=2714937 RepID=A0A6G7Y2M5_9ACTN|nr:PfkB family carbohydrate kinase [Propioniciclava coleopterorum]QIK71134.1 carbohydrate kinase [Propioniciclava coleopterorum]
MTPDPALLCIGEALIDVVLREGREPVEHVGGSLLNVAAGTAALGVDTLLASWWGRDARGDRLAQAARAAGVRVVAGSDGAERTPVAQARVDAGGHARYTFDLSWDVPALPAASGIGHVHTGSLAATVEPGGRRVAAEVARLRAGATVSYDPNARPAIMGSPIAVRARIEDLIALSDVVKASDEDIAWLYPGADPAAVLAAWARRGPALVVMTRGADGALARLAHDDTALQVAAPAVEVADTVGAGDSFMAGLLAGLWDLGLLGGPEARARLRHARWEDVAVPLRQAALTSALTVRRAGAHAPRPAEVRELDAAARPAAREEPASDAGSAPERLQP